MAALGRLYPVGRPVATVGNGSTLPGRRTGGDRPQRVVCGHPALGRATTTRRYSAVIAVPGWSHNRSPSHALPSLLTLLFVALPVRTVRLRVPVGDCAKPRLLRAIRADGNFAEYVPPGPLRLAMTEIQEARAALLNPALALN